MTRTVVVVGGGYGGTLVAAGLDDVADVVLIDPRDAFVNASASLRALTRPDFAPSAFFPFGNLLKRGRVIRDRVVSASPAAVTLASGQLVPADYLVLATGSSYPFPGKPVAESTAGALDDLRATHKELAAADSVLIVGSGPVGLELAGEIKAVWPDKTVTIAAKSPALLPGFLPEVQAELRRQLDDLGITVTTRTDVTADVTFPAYGMKVNSDFLADGRLVTLTARSTVPVSSRLTVPGHDHVYAVGDLADLSDPKMASYAQVQALVVVQNIKAQLAGEPAEAVHEVTPHRRILLPLGPRHGVGQLPAPHGAAAATTEEVINRKGADLFTSRFAQRFGGAASTGANH